jgi:hypothetical protein
MRCKLIVVFNLLIDVYVTMFLYACSDQTSARECVCVEDVCFRRSNLVVCIGK